MQGQIFLLLLQIFKTKILQFLFLGGIYSGVGRGVPMCYIYCIVFNHSFKYTYIFVMNFSCSSMLSCSNKVIHNNNLYWGNFFTYMWFSKRTSTIPYLCHTLYLQLSIAAVFGALIIAVSNIVHHCLLSLLWNELYFKCGLGNHAELKFQQFAVVLTI